MLKQNNISIDCQAEAEKVRIERLGSYSPTIFVVLPVHNRIETTRKFIECLKAQTYESCHLVLVDDGSSDGTAEYVKGRVDNLTILQGNGNLWWAGALTKAYKHLVTIDARDDDIVWICNDDVHIAPDYFEKVVKDPGLDSGSLVISPGHSIDSDFIERGFRIDWSAPKFNKLKEGEEPDAITTRGLYMHYSTYKAIGPNHPWLLPHYLSDLEYTIRGKRQGYRLVVSTHSQIQVDRTNTGLHHDGSKSLGEYLYNHLRSKKTAYSTRYFMSFLLLAAPWRYKHVAFQYVYRNFLPRLVLMIFALFSKKYREKL
ncbi:MAG: glycosyltransferase [Thermodesulfobacteriota bacterium]